MTEDGPYPYRRDNVGQRVEVVMANGDRLPFDNPFQQADADEQEYRGMYGTIVGHNGISPRIDLDNGRQITGAQCWWKPTPPIVESTAESEAARDAEWEAFVVRNNAERAALVVEIEARYAKEKQDDN